MLELGDAFSAITAQSFANPAESLGFPVEKQTDGEREWYAWKPQPADAEQFAAFIERLNGMDESGDLSMEFDPAFRVYAAKLANPEAIVTVTGSVGQDEFAAHLKHIAEAGESDGAAPSPFAAPAAKAAVDALGTTQLMRGLVNPEEAYLSFYFEWMGVFPASGTSADIARPIVARLAAEAKTNSAAPRVAFGVGAKNGRIALRAAAPAAAVSAGLKVRERFGKLEAEAVRERQQQQRQKKAE
jgi:hypothetical protein